jgi:sugar diacid utilization regulator
VDDLPRSYAGARTALRFAAEGNGDDPGPTVVRFDELGGLALLADASGTDLPDVRALALAANSAPWVLGTLQAVAGAVSLRAAAVALRLHHSSLQDRIVHAEHALGWNVREPSGRLRLQLALALRRLQRHP